MSLRSPLLRCMFVRRVASLSGGSSSECSGGRRLEESAADEEARRTTTRCASLEQVGQPQSGLDKSAKMLCRCSGGVCGCGQGETSVVVPG